MKLLPSGALVLLALLSWQCSEEGNDGTIAFQSGRDGNFEIYSMNADGSNQQRLTNSPSNDISPAWSPDGATIAFASDRTGNWEIFSMHADGSGATQLTHGQGTNTSPSWANGGKKILFVSTRDVINGEIYSMDPDGSGVERLTADSLVKDNPVMTPNGRQILFTVNTKGWYSIGAFFVGDRTVHRLTGPESNSLYPVPSPNGNRIMFISSRDGPFAVFTMDPSGENQTRIATSQDDLMTPSWTSRDDQILVSRRGGVYLLSLKDHTQKLLSFKNDGAPSWHPK